MSKSDSCLHIEAMFVLAADLLISLDSHFVCPRTYIHVHFTTDFILPTQTHVHTHIKTRTEDATALKDTNLQKQKPNIQFL